MKERLFKLLGVACSALLASLSAQAVPGDLDPTFASAGTVHFGFGGTFDLLNDAVLAPDGKIVAAGRSNVGGDGVFAVARYLADGSLDPSFGGTGVVLTNVVSRLGGSIAMDSAEGVRLQPDGKIVVAGMAGELDLERDFAIVRYQPDGSLDPSFGVGGVTRTDLSGNTDLASALAVQMDGKWVVAGTANGSLAVVRYHSDGSPDSGFGDGGKVILSGLTATFGNMRAASLTLQADGRIVLATSPFSVGAFVLARLNSNGSIDATFGNNGAIAIGVNSGICTAVAIQPGNRSIGLVDRIVAGGSSSDGTRSVFTAMRLNLNGTLDSSFGSGGVQTTDVSGTTARCNAVLVDVTGPVNRRIYLAGIGGANKLTVLRYSTNGALDTSFNGNGIAVSNFAAEANAIIRSGSGGIVAVGAFEGGSNFALARFDANGLLDPTFDQDGVRTDDAGGGAAAAAGVALQTDGRIIVTGREVSFPSFSVARLEPDGRLDNSFAVGGKLRTNFAATRLSEARAALLQPDGKILLAGTALLSNLDFALVRLHPNGSFDSSFDNDGVATTPMGAGNDLAQALALQVDGKIVVAGSFSNGFNQDVALARYNANGSLDATFDFDGRVLLALGTGDDEAHAVAIQPDGKIVIGGFAVIGRKQLLLARFNPNGSLDSSFGQDGVVRTAIGTGDAEINALALAPNGDIVVAGAVPESILDNTEAHFVVARYHASGTLDLSFANGGIFTLPAGRGSEMGGRAIALQTNGKILVGGAAENAANFSSSFTLLRFNSNGALDGSFGSGGQKTVQFGLGVDHDSARSLALDPSGRIVVAGQADKVFGVARLEGDPMVPTTLANISTRLRVQTGDNVLIGGFIVSGTQPKRVILRAIGPSLPVAGKLADPTLELFGAGGLITSNDNWRTGGQEAEIIATTVPPANDLESAIVATLPANNNAYTAIVRGAGNTSGVGLVEVYDLDRTVDSQLANISTRGFVQTNDDVMIGGVILVGMAPRKIIVRAIGPSLPVAGRLANPTLDLVDQNGVLVRANDDWRTGGQETEIIATTIPPANDLESAVVATLPAAPYTVIVRGKDGGTGIALVEVYALDN